MHRFIRISAFFGLILLASAVSAGETESFSTEGGYLVSLPVVGSAELITSIHEFKAELRDRRSRLEEAAAKNTMSVADVLITVVVPGGMLYAAARIHEKQRVKQELTDVQEDMAALEGDLAHFTAVAEDADILVARAN